MLDSKFGVYKFKPNQSGIFSDGRLGDWKSQWIINNEGWNSEITYKQNEKITGLIGDSYIQTIYFDPDNHAYNLFRNEAPKRVFYAFGIQGASFSQYLNILRYASDTYEMDSVIVFLDNNDLEESITSMIKMPRNMQLKIQGEEITEIPAVYHEKLYRNTLKEMAVFRYMLMNFSFRLNFGAAKENKKKNLEGKIDLDQMKKQAVDYIVDKMLQCNVEHITIVLDGDRPAIYAGDDTSSSKFWKYFSHIEQNERLLILDLHNFLKDDYHLNQNTFEISDDNNHWNLETNKKIVKYIVKEANLN